MLEQIGLNMFGFENIKDLSDAQEQLSTVKEQVTKEQAYVAATIANALLSLIPSVKRKEELNIVLSGITDPEVIAGIPLIKHYLPDYLLVNVLVSSLTESLPSIVELDCHIEGSKETLFEVLKRGREQRFDIHAAIVFDLDDGEFFASIKDNHLQPYVRGHGTKLVICHNSFDDVTRRMLKLKRFNITEEKTIFNPYFLEVGDIQSSYLVTLANPMNATRNEGFIETESTLRKMFNNVYFDPRFNSFGLHYTAKQEGHTIKAIFFDYEFCYDPFTYTVYGAVDGAFHPVAKFESDPFSIFSRELKEKTFLDDKSQVYIPFIDKEHAAKLRMHFTSLIKDRIEGFKEIARNDLISNDLEPTDERVNLHALAISSGHALRDTNNADKMAYRLFEHYLTDFKEEVKSDKALYFAKDIRGKELIFNIVKSDDNLDMLMDFIHHKDTFEFDVHSLDDDGFTLLDNAIINGAYKNAELLIRKGFNVNFANPFGFTALHRAYALNVEEGMAVLIKHGAKTKANLFGQEPQDLQPQEAP